MPSPPLTHTRPPAICLKSPNTFFQTTFWTPTWFAIPLKIEHLRAPKFSFTSSCFCTSFLWKNSTIFGFWANVTKYIVKKATVSIKLYGMWLWFKLWRSTREMPRTMVQVNVMMTVFMLIRFLVVSEEFADSIRELLKGTWRGKFKYWKKYSVIFKN